MSTENLPLFDRLPRSHRGDPETSWQAATELKQSGRWASQKRATLNALRQHDGATSGELAAYMGTDWLLPARRLTELERAGLVRKGTPRVCHVKRTICLSWWIVEDPPFAVKEGSDGRR